MEIYVLFNNKMLLKFKSLYLTVTKEMSVHLILCMYYFTNYILLKYEILLTMFSLHIYGGDLWPDFGLENSRRLFENILPDFLDNAC